MPAGNAAPHNAPSISDDVVDAFAMTGHRAFRRENDEVYALVGTSNRYGVVSDTWFGHYDSQIEFQQVLMHVASLMAEKRCRLWLADLRLLTSDFSASHAWLVSYLMPAAFKAGLEREAVVLPPEAVDVEGQDAFRAASKALRALADGRVRGFSDIALARRWLIDGDLPPEAR